MPSGSTSIIRTQFVNCFKSRAFRQGTALFLGAFALLLLVPGALAQDGEPGPLTSADLIPQDAVFYIKCSGIEQLMEKSQSLSLTRLFLDEEVQGFLKKTLEALPDILNLDDEREFPFKGLWQTCTGEVSLSLCAGPEVFQKGFESGLVLTLDMAGQREAFLREIGEMIDTVAWVRGYTTERKEVQGCPVVSVTHPDTGWGLCYAMRDDFFLVSMDSQILERIITQPKAAGAGLAGLPAFSRCLKHTGPDADFLAFLNGKALIELVNPLLGGQAPVFLGLLGLENMEALCVASILEGGSSRDLVYLDCPGEKKGLLKGLAPQPISAEIIAEAPMDVLTFIGFSVDPVLILDGLEGILGAVNPMALGRMQDELKQTSQALGVDFKTEFLRALGTEGSFVVAAPSGGGMSLVPDLVLTFTLADPDAFSGILQDKLFPLIANFASVGESTYDGITMRHVTPPRSQVPLSPTFAVKDNRLYIAGSVMNMKKHLKRLNAESPCLTDSESFGEAMSGMPFHASSIVYMDFKNGLMGAYMAASPFLSMGLAQSGLPLEAALLPMADTVANYFSHTSGFVAADEEGLIISLTGPLNLGALASLCVPVMDYAVARNYAGGLMNRTTTRVQAPSSITFTDPELGAAHMQMQEGSYEAASRRLSSWINTRGYSRWYTEWAYSHRGDCYIKLGKYPEAVQDYLFVADKDQAARGNLYFNVSRAYALAGDPIQSIEYLEKAVIHGYKIFEIAPDLASLWEEPSFSVVPDLVIATAHALRAGNVEEAITVFSEWIDSHPDHNLTHWALKTRADSYFRKEQYEEALADYQKATKGEGGFRVSALYNMACTCAILEDQEQGIDCLKEAIRAGFTDFEMIDYDSDLDFLRDHPRFKALLWSGMW